MRIGIDTGGTFTDVVIHHGGRVTTFKVPSTPSDPSAAILSALSDPRAAGRGRPGEVVHGSTVATNALLEGRTGPVALLATEGFEDILEIGRQDRASLYDLEVDRPLPLVPSHLRFGVPERVLADGTVRTPLDRRKVREAGSSAARAGARSLVVCFLHSYLRPAHELEAGEILREVFAGPVTLSHAIVREFREYERCSTAAVNAAVAPVMGAYLRRLGDALEGASLRIMASNGGAASPSRAAAEAVTTVLSGPAAGVVAALATGRRLGRERLITFDMGGTSTDVSLVPGEIRITGGSRIAGHPITAPSIDIHTVGAGGGSLAWIDPGGALKVGPRSAGADPGPACYGRGGPATVTDANLLLGRLPASGLLGGRMALDREASRRALSGLGKRLGRSPEEAAAGILAVANVTMARAIRQVSLFRGFDPSDFTLCAFGGAGGLHAADLASAAGITEVLVPPAPGVFSAWGLLAGDVVVARTATVLEEDEGLDEERMEALFRPLEEECRGVLSRELGSGAAGLETAMERTVEARYTGQSHELAVPARGWRESFHELHRRRFGFSRPGEPVTLVNVRVLARGIVPLPPPPSVRDEAGPPGDRRTVKVWHGGSWGEGRFRDRGALEPGAAMEGPAVIADAGATLWVPPGWRAGVREDGSLILSSGGGAGP